MRHRVPLKRVESLASEHGWRRIDYQENIGMVSFAKEYGGGDARVNVYLSKMTVATALNHPKQGKTQLYRRNVDERLLNKIFINPRVHTGVGYKTRN